VSERASGFVCTFWFRRLVTEEKGKEEGEEEERGMGQERKLRISWVHCFA
jgi:hypothetical protein